MTRAKSLLSARARKLVRGLHDIGDARPEELRGRVLDVIADVSESGTVGWYALGEHKGTTTIAGLHFRGADDPSDGVLATDWGGSLNVRHSRRNATRRFLNLKQALFELGGCIDDFHDSSVYTSIFEPFGLHDQARLMVTDGPRLIAWVGALRGKGEPAFLRRHTRALSSIVTEIGTAMLTAQRLKRSLQPEAACDVLLTCDGQIDLQSLDARGWTARPEVHRLLARYVRQLDRGQPVCAVIDGLWVRWSRLSKGPRVRYLLHLEPLDPAKLHPTFGLSRRQRDVARAIADGATLTEAAKHLGIGVETARSHLREAYRRLDVANRLELAALLDRS